MQTYVIRTLIAGNIGECRRSIRTRHTSLLLADSVRIGSHQANPLSRLCSQCGIECPSVTLAGVVKHIGIRQLLHLTVGSRISIFEVLIECTVVNTVQTCKTAYVLNAPV